jgi:hypothetical protein
MGNTTEALSEDLAGELKGGKRFKTWVVDRRGDNGSKGRGAQSEECIGCGKQSYRWMTRRSRRLGEV